MTVCESVRGGTMPALLNHWYLTGVGIPVATGQNKAPTKAKLFFALITVKSPAPT